MIAADSKAAQATQVLRTALAAYRGRIALACSFGGPSGMVLLDMVVALDCSVPVYYLDTGLLFAESYALVERVRTRYGVGPIAVRPKLTVDEQNARYGEALWTRDPDACSADVWAYVRRHDVPYNPLNDRGFPSLGCTHCTRAVLPGEDARAGRWAGSGKVECGLHFDSSESGLAI
ncbi:MAG: phosphoadenosine phosphosulfate reductase family protein [Candidatus Eremiobacteraeota bacterium]|nr:phosphoadenosine phosphosulfate reductase family protein [Candidatus Eremiobacteraeota bacterium]